MRKRTWVVVLAAVGTVVAGCAREPTQPVQYGQPGAYPPASYPPGQQPGAYPQGAYPPGQQPPATYPPATYPPATQPPPTQPPATYPPATQPPSTTTGGNLAPPPLGSFDAYGDMTPAFLRSEAKAVLDELVAALADKDRAKVQGIPLVVIEDPKEVNAFAGCDSSGKAFMGITAPLLNISAAGAEARAYDELTGSNKYDQYDDRVAAMVKAGQPVQGLTPGELPLPAAMDPRKLARQKFLFDEQIGFILGHELAHHYLGHTGCANGGASTQVTAQDIGRLLSGAVPLFNQPMEVEADVNGTRNVLTAGARHQGGTWTEEGALMTLGFFNRLTGFGPEVLLMGFLQTHPPPAVRIPIVQAAAQQWRAAGGGPTPQPSTPFPFPFPIPGLGG